MDLGENRQVGNCPSCHSTVEFTLSQVAEGASIQCSGCGSSINLVDKDGATKAAIGNVNGTVDDLLRSFR